MKALQKIFFLLITTLFISHSLYAKQSKLRFSTVPFVGEVPSYVAYSKGYFKEEGLDIILKQNAGGWMSLKDLFEGRADIATVADLPVVYSAFDKQKYTNFDRDDFYIIANMIYSQDTQKVVVRKDHGITVPKDLKGKRVGLMKGTTLDYYMDIFLKEHNIKYSEIEIVDMKIPKLNQALVKGELDAIITWEPNVHHVSNELGDNALTFTSNVGYTTEWFIVVMKEFAHKNPKTLEQFLKAIVKAENFIKKNPHESIKIHAKYTKQNIDTTKILWNTVDFDLSINEGMLTTMEGEAKWLIRKKAYQATEIPNFLDFIYFDALEKVKPLGIQIIR